MRDEICFAVPEKALKPATSQRQTHRQAATPATPRPTITPKAVVAACLISRRRIPKASMP